LLQLLPIKYLKVPTIKFDRHVVKKPTVKQLAFLLHA
jgi:hypothetical protein